MQKRIKRAQSQQVYRLPSNEKGFYVNTLTLKQIKILDKKAKDMKIGVTETSDYYALIPIFVSTCFYGFLYKNVLPNIILTLALISFSLFLMLFLYLLLTWTNASSISAMVAQRNNRISYCVTLLIICYSTFVSTCLLHRADRYHEFYLYTAALSAILSALILIFPLPVYKNMLELGFRPIDNSCKEWAWDKDLDYTLKFYPTYSEKCQKATHYTFIMIGLLLGWISVLSEMIYNQNNLWLKILYLSLSVICVLFFICAKGDDDNRVILYCEFLGLHFYILGLVMCIYDFDI